MADIESPQRRSNSTAGIVVALGALGLLLVLLLFQATPESDPPLDQGPVAMALVNNLMTNGVLVDYDCAKSTAWANRAVWTKYTPQQRQNMVVSLATVCDTRGAGYRISVVDYDSKREIAAFDGRTVTME